MNKRLLSIFLAIIMIVSIVPVWADADGSNITVYLSVSKYGQIVKNKNGEDMAYLEVDLNGKESYNLDDVFFAAHSKYYTDGEEGYGTSESEWGLGVDKLWGDTSYNFGYQVNGGTEMVSGLSHVAEDGDYIDACIYKNLYPDTESYARFDIKKAETYCGEEFALTLSYVSGYDENGNNVFSPCEGATITIDGEETEFTTDENGEAFINIEDEGTYTISAEKSKTLEEETVPAITAPVCVVLIKSQPEIEIIHNIAEHYANSEIINTGGNLPWIIADMAIYEEIFPDSENCLTDDKKEQALAQIIDTASQATKPGDLAKYILALRALGYDAKNVYTKAFEKVDIVAKLTDLVDNADNEITNIYTLPYVIIALCQADGYATDEQTQWLINSAIENKSQWQDTTYGTDAMTPMVLALAGYYHTDDGVKTVIDEAVEILKAEQREDGLIDGFEGYESASTGLAICALSALGIDSDEVINTQKSLIDGLISTYDSNLGVFPNAFATEQGFRGLLAWRLLLENDGKNMYDFSNYSMDEANATGAVNCPVIFNISPTGASVTIEGKQQFLENCFDLEEGSYTYTVSASGYTSIVDTVVITSQEVQNRQPKTITVSLSRNYYNSGGGGSAISVNPKLDEEEKQPEKQTETDKEPEKPVFSEETFKDVCSDDWYYPAVQYAYENNLFNGIGEGFEPNTYMSRAMLVTVLYRLASPDVVSSENKFEDVAQDMWYTEGVNWAAENGIVNGVSDTNFNPDADITREQFALIIYRYALLSGYDTDIGENTNIVSHSDYDKISEYAVDAIQYAIYTGIINGNTEGLLLPAHGATRAEVATMLMRFAELKID